MDLATNHKNVRLALKPAYATIVETCFVKMNAFKKLP